MQPEFLTPLAERMRPRKLENVIGQQHLLADKAPLANMLKHKHLPSIIFWGPPGVGKTTIANLIAEKLERPFAQISAINSGVKEMRSIIEEAQNQSGFILFIDEIHRFNKSQQDALLKAVETGILTLIGATTENPSFEVNNALLSRCQVFILNALKELELEEILNFTIASDALIKQYAIELQETSALLRISGGDVRKLLNALELVVLQFPISEKIIINNEMVEKIIKENILLYDKKGDIHYDVISAFIKSMRGSDPNAAVYYLARMIAGGEDVRFIARRMIIFASEDIGNANPNALLLANTCFEAVDKIGYPESRIILAHCAIYLATSPKSNASYVAIEEALKLVEQTGNLPVPLHLRNAPTKLMKNLNYGKEYQYPHHFNDNFIEQN
ncbi:MAG: replication-associated recombination protein A, partial [Sediminibacterium sp.]|nr:replication-associated recombination protein A [Sediminibacterium sp.]